MGYFLTYSSEIKVLKGALSSNNITSLLLAINLSITGTIGAAPIPLAAMMALEFFKAYIFFRPNTPFQKGPLTKIFSPSFTFRIFLVLIPLNSIATVIIFSSKSACIMDIGVS